MNTKEMVQFCEIELGEHPTKYYDKYFDQIINALKRGEKYEAMWGRLDDVLEGENPDYPDDIGDYNAILFMKAIKLKYFPKGGKI